MANSQVVEVQTSYIGNYHVDSRTEQKVGNMTKKQTDITRTNGQMR